MRRRHASRFAALGMWVLIAASGAAWAWPSVPLPEGSKGERVSDHMKYNGLDMRASRFATPLRPAAVIDFYARQWPGTHVIDRLGEKTIIGHAQGPHYVTVELVAAGGGTEGTIGIVLLPDKAIRPVLGEGFFKPVSTEVISDISYLDTPNETRTLVMRNRLTPYLNLQHYHQRLASDGWKSEDSSSCKPASRECIVRFGKANDRRLVMTMTRQDAGTLLVANIE